ncbi:MAG: 1-acyl-sn-glycerol-3-phosphate acyltransferase [Rubripirellula sp.]
MTVVFDRPYEFVPPHRGNGWPTFIQTFRIVDQYLKKKEGVVSYECRDFHHLRQSLDRGDGILLAPNHCRYADPLVLGWPARELNTHVYAMASWHLFNTGSFDSFAIRKMGGFSINREGTDRQSLETAIGILATAERPLILFPEGTTNRTNDVLKPLLDGVAFIARSAARKRAKASNGQVVMHPIAIKYLCTTDITPWAETQLSQLERRLGWQVPVGHSIRQRTVRLAQGLLALKEVQYLGDSISGPLPARRDELIRHLLTVTESRLGIVPKVSEVRARIRAIRSDVATKFFHDKSSGDDLEKTRLKNDVVAADLAQDLLSYPDCYLQTGEATDTRIVETIQRMQESLLGKADSTVPLRAVMQCAEAIVVPPGKAPRGEPDPVMEQLMMQLCSMLSEMSKEARLLPDDPVSPA